MTEIPDQPTAVRYPRFAPEAELIVDMHNGHERWTGAEWNAYVEAAERNRNIVTARLVECPPPVDMANDLMTVQGPAEADTR